MSRTPLRDDGLLEGSLKNEGEENGSAASLTVSPTDSQSYGRPEINVDHARIAR